MKTKNFYLHILGKTRSKWSKESSDCLKDEHGFDGSTKTMLFLSKNRFFYWERVML